MQKIRPDMDIGKNIQTLIMQKIRKILEFILALLNFLFHFKPVPDETSPIDPETFPRPAPQDPTERDEPLFETVR